MNARARRLVAAAAVTLAAAALPSLARAAPSAEIVRRGIAHAAKVHWLKPADAARYRHDVTWAVEDMHALPKLRARIVASQLAQLTPLWDSYVSPRALALFTQLEENLTYLETHRVPSGRIDVTDGHGVVYRFFTGLGLEFHPLAAFGRLDAVAAAEDATATRALADALLARAIPHGPHLVWEYSFWFGGGSPPWVSGMAEAVAAEALARAGTLLRDPSLVTAAARAYAAASTLVLPLQSGPWIRLYDFDREIVVNAQLQSILSFLEYGQAASDAHATALAQAMTAAAQALFGRFDTGDWSRYQLRGGYAPREYQVYVTQLLAQLAAQTQDPFWVAAAQRFYTYLYAPPQVSEGTPPPTLYPVPHDGWLDNAAIPITLSERASVTLSVAGKVTTWRFNAGQHALTWTPPATLAPGTYAASLSAVTYAGNKTTVQLAPLVVAWDTTPPPVQAQFDGTTLMWQGDDPGTPWLALTVTSPDGQTLDLGRQPTSGSVQLAAAPATLSATNSAGLTTTVQLGAVDGGG